MSEIEKRARELLAMTLGERGFHCEAENVRAGEDLESYEGELQAIAQLLRWGFNTPQGHARAALTPPEGYVLVPVEPTEAMIEAICTEHGSGGWPQGYGRYAQHIRREHAGEGYRAALSARPEVSP
jgi:hypothetical protein